MRSRRLPKVLRDIVTLTLASAGAYACSGDLGSDMESACSPGSPSTARASGLRPANPVDFMAFRNEAFVAGAEPEVNVHESDRTGEPCKSATDRPACEKRLAELRVATPDSPNAFYLVFTRGDQVLALKSREEIKDFLLPIDTNEEAFFLAAERFSTHCGGGDEPKYREGSDGYELLVYDYQGSCQSTGGHVDRVVVRVSSDGRVDEVEREKERDRGPCSEGRRPCGLRSNGRSRKARSNLGAYFAKAAHLEAASVVAFAQLERELAALGAPPRMLRALGKARVEEVRHTDMTTRLAKRFGATPPAVRVKKKGKNRSALAIAIENAREGCVRETLGAVIALHRAQRATDPEVARAMKAIADDELRHARLSWEMMEWLDTQLSTRGRAAVRRAFAREIAALEKELSDPPRDVVAIAGAPTAAVLRTMFVRLEADVWKPALAA